MRSPRAGPAHLFSLQPHCERSALQITAGSPPRPRPRPLRPLPGAQDPTLCPSQPSPFGFPRTAVQPAAHPPPSSMGRFGSARPKPTAAAWKRGLWAFPEQWPPARPRPRALSHRPSGGREGPR
ncbi:PREDICTED: translation initiation factor IF-2-like [Chinchilla lanigera]|uniref:translation initiation factor IF-2-like n=1 Tax=Chinchilla lanigera TaxID=34839 RepID=UPI0006979037|nr:PREDICTED: translation initiation factor IF-2-like [Chinchilla lanigera]